MSELVTVYGRLTTTPATGPGASIAPRTICLQAPSAAQVSAISFAALCYSPEEEWDGIGCALGFLRGWDGKALRLTIDQGRSWRPEAWADFWFVTRPREGVYPLRYIRFTANAWGAGVVMGPRGGFVAKGEESDEIISVTESLPGVPGGRQREYIVSLSDGALHVYPVGKQWHGLTKSVPSPREDEFGLYCEACNVTAMLRPL